MRSLRLSRDLRLARLPLLLAYLLVLLGTPVGEAGFLWMHLSTAHSTPATPGPELADRVGLRSGADAAVASAAHENKNDTLPPHAREHAREHGHPAPHEHASATEHAHGHEHPVAHVDERAGSREHEHAAERAVAYEHAAAREPAGSHPHPHAGSHANPPEHPGIASAGSEAEDRSVAPHEPHEHGGRVHTHGQHPVPDAELLIDALSKFYLSPPTTSAPAPSADARRASQIPPPLHQVAARIDTPPPRLPG